MNLCFQKLSFLGLAQITVGSAVVQRSNDSRARTVESDDSDDSSDIPTDETTPEFLNKKLEFMFRLYDLDRYL